MLPIIVLRRLDCVLEESKDAVLAEYERLTAAETPENAMDRMLGRAADPERKHPLYNTSPYTFKKLLGDPENIAQNLAAYIHGFSPTARAVFERFGFEDQIEKLDASNRLFTVKEMAAVDLHRDRITNLQMGLPLRAPRDAVQRAGQRGGRRPLHAPRGHPADGQPRLHRRDGRVQAGHLPRDL